MSTAMTCLKTFLTTILFLVVFSANAVPTQVATAKSLRSANSVKDTMDKIQTELKAQQFSIKTIIDHQTQASSVGITLPPMMSIFFGKPSYGSTLIANNAMAGIFVPIMLTVFQEKSGDVYVAYWDPTSIVKQLHITDPKVVTMVEGMSAQVTAILQKATQPS